MGNESAGASGDENEVWSVLRFAEELRELRRHAGSPALKKISDQTTGKWGTATLHGLFAGSGRGAPKWELVDDLVKALIICAHGQSLKLDAGLTDRDEWRKRHQLLQAAIEQEKTDQAVRRKKLLAQFSVLPTDQIQRPPFHTLSEVIDGWDDMPRPTGGEYLPRPDFDDELRAALATRSAPYPFLLVYGEDWSGKSTSAWTAVVETLAPETKVLISRDGRAIADLAAADDVTTTTTGPLLIWADGLSSSDLDRLTRETLESLADRAFLVATMSADECAAILGSPRGLMSTAKAALKRAYLVPLPYDPEIVEAVEQTAEAAGVELERAESGVDPRLVWIRLNTGRSQSPSGMAVVRSAIDCRRVGLTRPVLEDELKQLFPIYLSEIEDIPASDELFAEGMAWAQQSGPDTPPMLRSRSYHGRPSWVISEQLSEGKAPWKIPEALWPALVRMLDPQECFHIAREADEQGALVYATKALVKAATISENTARANVLLGSLFKRLGDLPAAKAALMTVISLGPSDEASAAADLLGRVFQEEGDIGHAIEYWTLATQWPGTHALMSWLELGRHYASVGDKDNAVAALNRDFSDPLLPGLELRASTLLSFVRGSVGDLQALLEVWETGGEHRWGNHDDAVSAVREYVEFARSAEESAHQSGVFDPADIDVALADARRRFELGDLRGAMEAYRGVAASGQSDLRAAALFGAGSTASEMGLLDEAMEAYEGSILCAQADYSAQAALSLGSLLWEKEARDAAGAIRAWTSAKQLGDPQTQAKAAFNIGVARHNAQDYRSAVSELQYALRLADAGFKAKVTMMLAETHQAMGADAAIIDDYYHQALQMDDAHYSPMAAVTLGSRIYDREGPSPEALRMTRLAYVSHNLASRGEAAWRLGNMLEEREELEGAITAYKTAIETDHVDWAPAGHCALGLLHGMQNRTNMAMRHLRAAYDSGHPEYRLEAAFWMAMFYWWDGAHGKEGKLRNAVIMLRQVVDSGNPKWEPQASSALAKILENLEDPD
jgi:tetratricopeptide (TPR) repeat protein